MLISTLIPILILARSGRGDPEQGSWGSKTDDAFACGRVCVAGISLELGHVEIGGRGRSGNRNDARNAIDSMLGHRTQFRCLILILILILRYLIKQPRVVRVVSRFDRS